MRPTTLALRPDLITLVAFRPGGPGGQAGRVTGRELAAGALRAGIHHGRHVNSLHAALAPVSGGDLYAGVAGKGGAVGLYESGVRGKTQPV